MKAEKLINNGKILRYGILLVWTIVALVLFSSCATKKQIEYRDREVVKYVTKVHHDTLINNVHDSIYHTIFQKGDTIYDTKYVYHTKYRDKIVAKTDTCYKDSIQVQEKTNIKEKKVIPKWCYFSLFLSVLFIIFVIIKIKAWLTH
jgi:hypothetical protein